MGVDAADFDGDGWEDLFVANVDHEMFSLYRNKHDETFADVAHANSVAQATSLLSGWGLKFFDYDNDGLIDLILSNGHPDDMIDSLLAPGEIQGAAAAVSQRRRQAAQCQCGCGAGVHQDCFRRAAWRWAISITTAGWMC